MPTAPATSTAERPIRTEVFAPWITRLRMSRPSWSVPSTASVPSAARLTGRVKRARRFCSFGSAGASHAGRRRARRHHEEDRGADAGAPRSQQDAGPPPCAPRRGQGRPATRAGSAPASSRMTVAARRTRGSSAVYDEVDDDVQEQEGRRHREHHRLDQRHVLVDHRLHGQPAEAGVGEHRLGDDRAAQEVTQLEAERGHDGDRAVAEGVPEDHRPLADALGPRRSEEVLVQAPPACSTG